jgi:hypothetical protein
MKISTCRLAFGFVGALFFAPASVNAQCLTSTTPTNNCSYGDAVDNITINGNSVSNAGCSGTGTGYTFFPTPVWNFTQGASYPISLTVGGAQYNQGVRIWIDFDGNGQFDATDVAYTSTAPAMNHTGTLVIPAVTTLGTVRMRVMCTYNTTPATTGACTSNVGSYGETEDYDVVLAPAVLADDVEATSIERPLDGTCGMELDTVTVRITNLGTNNASNVGVALDVTGAATGTFTATIPTILSGSFEDVNIAILDTRNGGVYNFTLGITMTGDGNTVNNILMTTVNKINATDLVVSGPTDVCDGETADLSVNDVAGENYTWSEGGGPTTNGTTYTTSPLSASTTVTVSSDNTCRADGMWVINVIPSPTISFTATPTSGSTVDFLAAGSDFNTLDWDFGDGGTSTTQDPTHTYAVNGTYYVCVTAANDCDTVMYCDSVLVSNIGLAELGLGEVSVFPNPTSDIVHIDFSNLNGLIAGWVLVDMDGRTLESGELEITQAQQQMKLSLGAYAPGNYILKVNGSNGEKYKINLVRN